MSAQDPEGPPAHAGFVLVGGLSSRMGRDKALLPLDGSAMAAQIAKRVLAAAGSVTLIGPPERYRGLGYPVIADRVAGCGPLGGVFTALADTNAEWNLIVACDMPGLTAGFLDDLLRVADSTGADCVVPQTSAGLDPLCAVYHRRCAAAAESAIHRKSLTMHDFISSLRTTMWPVSNSSYLANVNTPEQWSLR